MKPRKKDKVVKLLWTGGWDSTFRLCEVVVLDKNKVQPFYLIDENRRSLCNELMAQKEIKAALFQKFPYTKDLILPAKIFSISDLETDPEINRNYATLRHKVGFGMQYAWLATFCKVYSIDNIELSFEKAENGRKRNFLKPYMHSCAINNRTIYKIISDNPDSEISELFKYYVWPLWETSRIDMIALSKHYGFFDVLNLSWFCHSPIRNRACGVCNPCKDVVENGMNYRLNKSAKIRYNTRNLTLRALKQKLTNLNKNEYVYY